MRTKNLFSTGILILSLASGVRNAGAQDDGSADATPVDPSVIARLKAARAAADAGNAPATDAGTAATPEAAATPAADAGAVTAPAPGVTAPDAGTAAAANAASTPAASEPAPKPGTPPTLAAFDLIWQRNVFDPSRVPYNGGGPRTNLIAVRARPRQVQTLVFCGTGHKVGMGYDAFFSGYGAPPSGVLDVGDPVNGLKIAAITDNAVTLVDPNSTNNAKYVVSLENGPNAITRADSGPWQTMYVSTTYAAPIRPTQLDNNAALTALQMDTGGDTGGFGGYNPGGFGGQTGGFGAQFGGGGGGGRVRGGRGGRGGGGAGGGGGGFAGGGGGGGNFGFNTVQQETPVAPPAPADPAVLARLQARRAAGN